MGLSIHLLGQPRMELAGTPIADPRGHKAWGLLAYLLRSRVPPSRERVASLLFPEADDPLGALRWTLSALRRRLGEEAELGGDPLRLTLPPGTFVDVDVLSRGSWIEAIALPGLGHGLLEGLAFRSSPGFEMWLEGERRHVAGTTSAVLHQAALALLARGEAVSAAHHAAELVGLNPYEENAHVLLVRCLRVAGDSEAAHASRRGMHRALQTRAGHRADCCSSHRGCHLRGGGCGSRLGASDSAGAGRGRRGRARRRRDRSRSPPSARRRRGRSKRRRPRAPLEGAGRARGRARPLCTRHGRGRHRRAARRYDPRGAGRTVRRRREGMARDQLGPVPACALRTSGGVVDSHRRARRRKQRGARLGRADSGGMPARRRGLRGSWRAAAFRFGPRGDCPQASRWVRLSPCSAVSTSCEGTSRTRSTSSTRPSKRSRYEA